MTTPNDPLGALLDAALAAARPTDSEARRSDVGCPDDPPCDACVEAHDYPAPTRAEEER